MPSLPIPLIASLVLGFLLFRVWVIDRRHGPLMGLLAICAVQGVIISLGQHYMVPGFRAIQPITATLVAPMAWVAFQTTAVRRVLPIDGINLLGPLCACVALVVAPAFLDLLIPVMFVGYGLAIIWHSRRGPDPLPRMRLGAGDTPSRIWQIIGIALVGSALCDVLIVAVQIAGAGHIQPWIISIGSSGMVLIVGALTLSRSIETVPHDPKQPIEPNTPPVSDEDVEIFAKLETMMTTKRLYLNPDLTLSQLSRRLLIPAKQLSSAINRVTGENVSRYINAARIRAAQTAMLDGENVTNAMLSSGFNTKSNFNREFLRVTGTNPRDWLNEARSKKTLFKS